MGYFTLGHAKINVAGEKMLNTFDPAEDRTRISCVAVRHSTASL